jgi:hypothetical protein
MGHDSMLGTPHMVLSTIPAKNMSLMLCLAYRFSCEAASVLSSALLKNSAFSCLSISSAAFQDQGETTPLGPSPNTVAAKAPAVAQLISRELAQHPTLETLDLSTSQLKPAAAAALAEFLAVAQGLAVVKLQQCRLGDDGVEALTEGLTKAMDTQREDSEVTAGVKDCGSSSSSSHGAVAGAIAVRGCHAGSSSSSSSSSGIARIKHLDLAGNGITSRGAGALGQLLARAANKRCHQASGGASSSSSNCEPRSSSSSCDAEGGQLGLQYFSLAENEVDVVGPLCDGLRHAHKLLELDLQSNRIRGEDRSWAGGWLGKQ